MKKNLLIIIGASAALLASCGQSSTPTKSVDEVMGGFKSEASGKVTMVYNANYDVDVDAHGGTANMSSFKHKIRAKTEINMSLDGEYFYAKKTWQDSLVSTTDKVTEYLLVKGTDSKYYYSTTNDHAVEVENPSAKLAEVFTAVTQEQAGALDLGILNYSKTDKEYELKYIGLTDTFTTDDLNDPTYSVNANEGLDVEYKAAYVGYQTDGGVSDFSNTTDGYAGILKLSTDKEGNVVSWNEQYNNAALDFAIMTPAPTVIITGGRSFTATYDATYEEKSEVAYVEKMSTVNLAPTENGSYSVKWFDYDAGSTEMTAVNDGGQIKTGMWLAIAPVAAENYEVDAVKVNGQTTEITIPAGPSTFYCFKVVDEVANVTVTFKSAGSTEPVGPTLLYTYAGAHSNGTAMEVNLFDDNNFTITCPGFGGAKAVDGTYVMDQAAKTITCTSEEGHVQFIPNVTSLVVTYTVSADFQTISTTAFYDGGEITFTLKK